MGNVISEEEANKRIRLIRQMQKIVQTKYDLNNYKGIGQTEYLDLIDPNWIDPNTNVITGYDSFNRPFFAFFAVVVLSDGTKLQTFTTFFQRHSDNQMCWMFCGNMAQPLFCSTGSGGAETKQFETLKTLFETGRIDVPEKTELANFGIRCEIYSFSMDEFKNTQSAYPVEIYLGKID